MTVSQFKPRTRYDALAGRDVPIEGDAELYERAEATAQAKLLALYSDRAATKDDTAKHAAMVEQAREAEARRKKAEADDAARVEARKREEKRHADKLAAATLAHEQAIERSRRDAEMDRAAAAAMKKEAANELAAAKADRERNEKDFAAVRDAIAKLNERR